ncbi:MAG: amidohydrolase family protein [Ruminococcus sp.]|nr:amidohydrolase family protein [Ruminococcus sp.]
MDTLLFNAHLVPVTAGEIEKGYVYVKDERILSVNVGEPDSEMLKNCEAMDCGGGYLYPGFIDAHSHIGLIKSGGGIEGDDINEESDPITPQMRAIDALDPSDSAFFDARKSGVTVAVTGAGSANVIGGDLIVISTYGEIADKMLIKQCGIKFSLGENPKATHSDKDNAPYTRMSIAALIREALFSAHEYLNKKTAAEKLPKAEISDALPDFDIKCESLIPLLKNEISAHFHCHTASDIATAIRIAEEFGLTYTLVHCSEGYLIADYLKEKNATAIIGPLINSKTKPELSLLSERNAALLPQKILTAISTDHPEVPVDFFLGSVCTAIKGGMDKNAALRAITINPAKIVGIDRDYGSIEAGKRADFVLLDREFCDFYATVLKTIVGGRIVYEGEGETL